MQRIIRRQRIHIQAYKIAEQLSLPVMVCMDGFILTHAYEPVDIPDQKQVDDFLPPFKPTHIVDPDGPEDSGYMPIHVSTWKRNISSIVPWKNQKKH